MDKFQIRTDYHDYGEMWISRDVEGNVLLHPADAHPVNLGRPKDALLVAKCIEVTARGGVSRRDMDTSREQLRKALEQLKADDGLTEP